MIIDSYCEHLMQMHGKDVVVVLPGGLTPDQYIQLRAWDIIEKKQGANIDVLFDGSAQHMWNIKRN